MKNYETIKNICAFCAFFSLMFGGCLADNVNLLPTFLLVCLAGFFVFIYTKIEKAQEEKK